jgi:hypothetical protein
MFITSICSPLLSGTHQKAERACKGHSLRLLENLDQNWSTNDVTSGLSSGEVLIWAVRDPIERLHPVRKGGRVVDSQKVLEDADISDKRLLVIETELASTLRVLTREGNTLSAIVRQAWDGQDLRTLTKNSPARATKPHISIIGHITRDELRRYLDATEMREWVRESVSLALRPTLEAIAGWWRLRASRTVR